MYERSLSSQHADRGFKAVPFLNQLITFIFRLCYDHEVGMVMIIDSIMLFIQSMSFVTRTQWTENSSLQWIVLNF